LPCVGLVSHVFRSLQKSVFTKRNLSKPIQYKSIKNVTLKGTFAVLCVVSRRILDFINCSACDFPSILVKTSFSRLTFMKECEERALLFLALCSYRLRHILQSRAAAGPEMIQRVFEAIPTSQEFQESQILSKFTESFRIKHNVVQGSNFHGKRHKCFCSMNKTSKLGKRKLTNFLKMRVKQFYWSYQT